MIKRVLLGIALCLCAAMPLAPRALAAGDELAPSEDNGAAGRNSFNNAGYQPPPQACHGQKSAAGSTVIRKLPAGPRRADGSLAFTAGVCIYLPPDYATSTRHYPSLYLLHGGGGDQGNWMTLGEVQRTMDEAYARDHRNALIVVSPDGTDGQWYDAIDGSLRIEEYVLRWVVPYIDRHYRTIADRRSRAIDGLSNGGYGAMHLAAKAPDLFSVAGAMSANLGGRSFGGWGNAMDDPAYGHGQTPADLAGNLDDVDLTFDWGASCSSDVTVDLCTTWAFEQSFRLDNQYFQDQLKAVGHKGADDYRETEGGHAWRWWSMWLRERHLPFILSRMRSTSARRTPPSSTAWRQRQRRPPAVTGRRTQSTSRSAPPVATPSWPAPSGATNCRPLAPGSRLRRSSASPSSRS
ncbi:MAG TPA: alpha/beta hydrolase-fold protein [Acidimicrobiales bacterium]|nr:alpha/beta hydrolase-fold protein [Acidimicrobiales bacterium]